MRRSARISHRGAHFGHLFFAGVIGCSLAWSNPVRFVDVTAEAGITHSHHSTPASQFSIFTRFHGHQDIVESMTGGVALLDFDQDGWLDLLVANGHLYSNVDNDAEPKLLYRNNRDGTYSEVFSPGGSALLEKRVSRGAAFGDLDNDGDIDVVVNQLDGKPMVLRNEGGNRGNWLRVKAEGRAENRFAVGARIKVVSGDLAQRAEIRSGASYLSQNDLRLHFGLGRRESVDLVEVQWPGGGTTRREQVQANQEIRIGVED